jgi:hypothetical protein
MRCSITLEALSITNIFKHITLKLFNLVYKSFVDGLNKIFSSVMLVEIWGILGTQCILAFQVASVR